VFHCGITDKMTNKANERYMEKKQKWKKGVFVRCFKTHSGRNKENKELYAGIPITLI